MEIRELNLKLQILKRWVSILLLAEYPPGSTDNTWMTHLTCSNAPGLRFETALVFGWLCFSPRAPRPAPERSYQHGWLCSQNCAVCVAGKPVPPGKECRSGTGSGEGSGGSSDAVWELEGGQEVMLRREDEEGG